MVLPYWLKPDYWRLPIQFLHQCHPPSFPPHLIHHLFYRLEDLPYLVVESLPHPPGAMPPIKCGSADPVSPDLVGIFCFCVSFLEGP